MARKHPQVIAHHATSAANNPQPPPRRYRGRRQLTRGAARRAGRPERGGDQQTGAGRPAQPPGADPLPAGRGVTSQPGRAGRAGDRPVSGRTPAAASSNHAGTVAWMPHGGLLGSILLPAGPSRAVLLPPGQRLPAPFQRVPGGYPRYLTVMVLSITALLESMAVNRAPRRRDRSGRSGRCL